MVMQENQKSDRLNKVANGFLFYIMQGETKPEIKYLKKPKIPKKVSGKRYLCKSMTTAILILVFPINAAACAKSSAYFMTSKMLPLKINDEKMKEIQILSSLSFFITSGCNLLSHFDTLDFLFSPCKILMVKFFKG
ncbi:CLUMA_CG013509, isoform A [Clunio marinus]|uniref:CLUMA_CG013509, isoform A n=1 Tax=Clunio marinus TaxID=568069 RepID=A0A1J1IL06_9DIPT|nr:CLUMA_CG013509, isoform A [Clunio marinus]